MKVSWYYITKILKVKINWFAYKRLNYTRLGFYNNKVTITIIFLLQFIFFIYTFIYKNVNVSVIKTWLIYLNKLNTEEQS